MLIVLLFLTSGILLGLLLRRQEKVIRITDQLITWTIYLFLFLLGIYVGIKEEIFGNLGQLGIQAFIITAGAVIGSVLASYFVYVHLLREPKNEE